MIENTSYGEAFTNPGAFVYCQRRHLAVEGGALRRIRHDQRFFKEGIEFSVGETGLKNDTFQGVNRTSWSLLKAMFTRRTIKLTLVFTGPDLHSVKVLRSKLNSVLFGRSELYITEDGFYYDVVCNSLGAEVLVGIGNATAQIKAEYTFEGVRRGPLKTETIAGGSSFWCESTMPFTDCRLTVTVGTGASSYTLGGATFGTVAANDVLVFDGIDGKITKNGTNVAGTTSWVDFPTLTPGINTIEALDDVTVEYYPVFI